jgi:hypothetical protein
MDGLGGLAAALFFAWIIWMFVKGCIDQEADHRHQAMVNRLELDRKRSEITEDDLRHGYRPQR